MDFIEEVEYISRCENASIKKVLEILRIPQSTYYERIKRKPNQYTCANNEVFNLIYSEIIASNFTYGSERLSIYVDTIHGMTVSRQRISKIMKGRELYKKRKETVERSFADGKEKHGLRFTRYKSLKVVDNFLLLLFASMNVKKLALLRRNHPLFQFLFIIFQRMLLK